MDDWSRIQELYHAVLERQPGERAAFLLQACPTDLAVRSEVESLLAHEGQADRLLESPVWNPEPVPAGTGVAAPPVLAAGSAFGTYRIVGLLGVGGMGEVYRAVDTKLHREVAIKVLPAVHAREPDWLSRFQGEARVLASLNHPGIAAIHGLEESGGICALVMEFVEGPTLADYLARGPIPLGESLAIAKQIAEALDCAHEQGLVHRDLKPANIKITPEGVVKLLDFGLAKASRQTNQASPVAMPTETGLIVGTPSYMAPEQARGRNVDRRADIWAFGVVLWEMLAGRQLFQGATVSDTLAAVLTREPDLDAVPLQVRRLLRLCLTRDRRERLSNISTALVLLDEQPPPAPSQRPRTRWLWPVAAILCLSAAAALITHYRPETRPELVVARFQVPLPEGTSFGEHMAVSPDGRKIAVSARGADGHAPIWIHDLDKGGFRPLPGTGNGRFFFWSPDSRYLAFWVDNQLKKVDIAGGPPQLICTTLNTAIGGAWRSDGVILFSERALWRVSASGGMAARVTELDREADHHHAWPVFLPDGQQVLYHILSRSDERTAVYVAKFRSDGQLGPGKLVALSRIGPRYVPGSNGKGSLLLLRGTTLFVQEFDESRLQTVGNAHPLLEQVGYTRSIPYFSASRNGVLAWLSASSESTSLVWFDRQGKRIGNSVPGEFANLALSADGQRVAVTQSEDAAAKPHLSVVDLRHGSSIRLTYDPGQNGSPVWSPDQQRIAYGGVNTKEIRVVTASGAGSSETLLRLPFFAYPLDWSRDGRYLLFQTASGSTDFEMRVLPMDSPSSANRKPFPYLTASRKAQLGRFSPDGRFVAYVSEETGRLEVYVQQFPAAGGKWPISKAGGSQPRWRSDGKELFFLDPERILMSVAVSAKPEFRVSEPQRLFQTYQSVKVVYGQGFGYDVSPDGRRFLVNSGAPAPPAREINVLLNWQTAQP